MTSKSNKKASLSRLSDRTKDFAKDWQRLKHAGRYNMKHLKDVMMLLIANDAPLPPEYSDHRAVWPTGSLPRAPYLRGLLADVPHPARHRDLYACGYACRFVRVTPYINVEIHSTLNLPRGFPRSRLREALFLH